MAVETGLVHGRRTVRVSLPLEARYWANCRPIEARVEDVSESGLFLSMRHPLSEGQVLELEIGVPDGRGTLRTSGRVVWVEYQCGAGVELMSLPESERIRLRDFVAAVYFGWFAPPGANESLSGPARDQVVPR